MTSAQRAVSRDEFERNSFIVGLSSECRACYHALGSLHTLSRAHIALTRYRYVLRASHRFIDVQFAPPIANRAAQIAYQFDRSRVQSQFTLYAPIGLASDCGLWLICAYARGIVAMRRRDSIKLDSFRGPLFVRIKFNFTTDSTERATLRI